MLNIRFVLVLVGVILCVLAGFNIPSPSRVSLGWMGIALFGLAWLVP